MNYNKAVASITIYLVFAPIASNAQEFPIDPQLAGVVDVVNIRTPVFEPTEDDGILIWSEVINRPKARFIRLRVTVESGQASGDARLNLGTSSDPAVWTMIITPDLAGKSFWSPPLHSRLVEATLVAREVPVGLVVNIDRVAYTTQPGRLSSIIGLDQRQDIADVLPDPLIQALESPVAKLSFVKNNKMYVCTGFMVSSNLMVTNEHCVNSMPVCQTTSALFGFMVTSGGNMTPGESYTCIGVEDVNHELDYAVLRLDGLPGDRWGSISLDGSLPVLDQNLMIIQHPAGEPKQISLADCAVTVARANGRGTGTDFAHSCDTLGGSSGSPVFAADGSLVGLHHFGKGGVHWNENRAVRLDRIIQNSSVLQNVLDPD